MKSTRLRLSFSVLSLVTMGGAILASCAPRFRTECPEGKIRVGSGDVDDENVCKAIEAGSAGAAGEGGAAGDSGSAGSGPAMGSGGSGGAGGMVPPGFDCAPGTTKCVSDAQQTCGGDGKWGTAVGCDVACSKAGDACLVPVQLSLGTSHGCARMSDGTVRCWGNGANGQLGNVNDQESLKPKLVEGLEGVVDIVTNDYNTCARLSDETVSCWGDNDSYSLQSVQLPVRFPNPMGVQNIKSSTLNTENQCVLTGQGVVLCKGQDAFGGCGNGHSTSAHTTVDTFTPAQFAPQSPSVTQLFSGHRTHFAVASDGQVLCWGVDQSLDPGTSDYGICPINGGVFDMNVDPRSIIVGVPTLLPGLASVRSIAAGINSACAVHLDGKISCWGRNRLYQAGPSSGSHGPVLIYSLDSVQQAALGTTHSCAVTTDGRLFCWGGNAKSQLGASCSPVFPCAEGSNGEPFVNEPSLVQLLHVVEVRASGDSTCARTEEGKVLCWGSNEFGQLGNGEKTAVEPVPRLVVWK